ncbi:MAG TPA: diguanylate cyclase [Vicinamibacteria bacterium]|jgi:diguanylate cyclase (GGDEF)-like protein
MRRPGLTFQARIQLLVLLSVGIPLVGAGSYLLRKHHAVLEEKVRETLSNHLFRTTTRLDAWFQQRLHEVTRWSASFIVFEGMEALGRPGPGAAAARADLNEYLGTVLGHYGVYESLFVLDPAGNVVAGTRDEAWEPWEPGVLQVAAGNGMVSPIYRSKALGRPTCVVLHDIQGRASSPIGFLAGRIKLSDLEAQLLSTEKEAPAFWLIDAQGRVLLGAGHVLENPGQETFPAEVPPPGVESSPVVERALPGLGKMVVALRRRSGPDAGFVGATLSADQAYASLRQARQRLTLSGIALIAAMMLVSTMLVRSMLRPIADLAHAAGQVKAGNYDVNVRTRGSDELAEASRAFNEMAAHIRGDRHKLVTEREQFEKLSITDDLTGLFNRRHFDDTLEDAMDRCAASGQPLSLLLIDLDHFKQYNDRWGHSEGDAELKRVAAAVQSQVRASSDKGFRYGGEELAVVMPYCSRENAALRAERIRLAVRTPSQRPGATEARFTTVSIGVATFPEDGRMARALVDMADSALYAAKRLGRDRVWLSNRPVPEAPDHDDAQSLALGGGSRSS